MPKTPKQIAESGSHPEQQQWLLDPTRTPREIVQFIQDSSVGSHSTHLARTTLEVRISEVAEASSIRLEQQTKTLIRLTYALVGLTVGLLILTFFLVKHP